MLVDDEAPAVDPLFIGLTRPPMVWGVPMLWFGMNFIIFGVGLIAFLDLLPKLMFLVTVNLPLHVFGYLMSERDAHWMRILVVRLNKCGPTKTKAFWKSQSFAP